MRKRGCGGKEGLELMMRWSAGVVVRIKKSGVLGGGGPSNWPGETDWKGRRVHGRNETSQHARVITLMILRQIPFVLCSRNLFGCC